MENNEILNFCLSRGLLLDKEILNVFSKEPDLESLKIVIEKIRSHTQKRIITKDLLENEKDFNEILSTLPRESKKKLEKLKIKLGLSIEISKEREIINNKKNQKEDISECGNVKVITQNKGFKKIEVKDFIGHFRKRFLDMRKILQEHSELKNLISINKISNNKQNFSVIGIVSSKRTTKNKNILLEIEDLTGNIKVLLNNNKKELCKKAEEICLDSVIGFKGSGNRNILFANEIIFPDARLFERKKSLKEEYALFIGDLHFGSKRFLKENFLRFINYLNGEISPTPEVNKIKYLFIVGDVITGVGNYPNQEKDLEIYDIEQQFIQLAKLLGKIRKDIKIIISPGNHDGVRLMEPQPTLDKKYAWSLYEMENVIITGNPAEVIIGLNEGFGGFRVLTYHGYSFPYYANNISELMLKRAMNSPELIMKFLLKHRHLAPSHGSTQYFPSEDNPLGILEIPDIFVAAHTHKSAVTYYNNILIISTSCWEAMTPYQEKFGNVPDHCKVPMLNLKNRAVKVLDFE